MKVIKLHQLNKSRITVGYMINCERGKITHSSQVLYTRRQRCFRGDIDGIKVELPARKGSRVLVSESLLLSDSLVALLCSAFLRGNGVFLRRLFERGRSRALNNTGLFHLQFIKVAHSFRNRDACRRSSSGISQIKKRRRSFERWV